MANALTSSYIPVCNALRTACRNHFPKTVGVWRGLPMDRMQKDYIAIGGMEEGVNDFPVSRQGRKPRDEDYLLMVNIAAVRGGAEADEAEAAMMEMYQDIESILADDVALGMGPDGDGTRSSLRVIPDDYSIDSFYEEGTRGWKSVMVLKLRVKSRLV